MSPPPTTFAEGMRRLFGLAVLAAGIAFGIAILVAGGIVVFGNWGKALLPEQLHILAGLLAAACINNTIVIVGLLVGGPVGRFKGEVSDGDKRIALEASNGSDSNA